MPNSIEMLLIALFAGPIPAILTKIWLLHRAGDGIPCLRVPPRNLKKILWGILLICSLPICCVLLAAFVLSPSGISALAQSIIVLAILANAVLLLILFETLKISRITEIWIEPDILDCLMIRDKNGQRAVALKDADIKVKRPLQGPGGVQVFNYLIKADDIDLNLAIPWDNTMGVEVKYMDTVKSCGGLLATGSPSKIASLHRLLQGFAF